MPRRRPSKAGHPWLPAWFSMAGMKLLCTGKHFLYVQGIMATEQSVHPASSLPGSDVNSSTQHLKMTAQLGTPPFNALPPTAASTYRSQHQTTTAMEARTGQTAPVADELQPGEGEAWHVQWLQLTESRGKS